MNDFAIFRNDIEQTGFGRFATSQDALGALMMSGVAGRVLNEYSVIDIHESLTQETENLV